MVNAVGVEAGTEFLDTMAQVDREQVLTATTTVKRVVDLVPAEVWQSPATRVLDPCTKGGEFLKECAKRLWTGLADELPDEGARRRHILAKALHGVATSKLTAEMSRRTLYCCRRANGSRSIVPFVKNPAGNIDDGIRDHRYDRNGTCLDCGDLKVEGEVRATHPAYGFLHGAGRGDMHFNLIIGNPPYQRADGGHGASASPVYHQFVDGAIEMNPDHLIMIIPARWYTGGKGLADFRRRMMADRRIAELHDVEDATMCFPDNNISGGVCYFRWSTDHDDDCRIVHVDRNRTRAEVRPRCLDSGHGFIVRREHDVDILQRVQAAQEPTLNAKVSTLRPFGLRTYERGLSDGDLALRHRDGWSRWSKVKLRAGKDLVEAWKVIVSRASGGAMRFDEHGRRAVLSVLDTLGPGAICTETYLTIGRYESQTDAERVKEYLDLKLPRYLIGLTAQTQDFKAARFRFVPDIGAERDWTDQEL